VETVHLPTIKAPVLPAYKKGPQFWQQTTGLMCACDIAPYSSPIVIREINIPAPPTPRFTFPLAPIPQQAVYSPPMTYADFGMNESFILWGNRPYEKTWAGSDGRIFLRPKGVENRLNFDAGGPEGGEPNTSDSPNWIGTDEYYFEGKTLVYGPYRYEFQGGFRALGSISG
jgi:hypothetical protein